MIVVGVEGAPATPKPVRCRAKSPRTWIDSNGELNPASSTRLPPTPAIWPTTSRGTAGRSRGVRRPGANLLAADAAADAGVVWTRLGHTRNAAAASCQAIDLADQCQGATIPSLRSIKARADLTAAEHETAVLAAAGYSNKGSLRWVWNRAKGQVAPWWAENSKEAYSAGAADLAKALSAWRASKIGARARAAGRVFPRFKSGRRDPGRVRFTTGTMRVEQDRRTITVPVIGGLRAKENTRRVRTSS
jgi:hypothetical protein